METQRPFMKLAEVIALTSVSRTSIYRWMKTGDFPKQITIAGTARWSRTEINEWIDKLLADRLSRIDKIE